MLTVILKNMLELSCLDVNIKTFDRYAYNFFYTLRDSGGYSTKVYFIARFIIAAFNFLKHRNNIGIFFCF